jgi:hypothetical protein
LTADKFTVYLTSVVYFSWKRGFVMPRARNQQISIKIRLTIIASPAVFVGRFYVEKILFLAKALSTAEVGLKIDYYF